MTGSVRPVPKSPSRASENGPPHAASRLSFQSGGADVKLWRTPNRARLPVGGCLSHAFALGDPLRAAPWERLQISVWCVNQYLELNPYYSNNILNFDKNLITF